MLKLRSRLVALMLVSLLASSISSPALANSFPGNSDGTVANDSTETFCLGWSFTTDTSLAWYALIVLDQTTDMTYSYHSTCQAYTDAVWWEANLDGTTRGRRECYWYGSGGTCLLNDLWMDFNQIDCGLGSVQYCSSSYTWEDRAKTAVHELGHAVGLGHDESSSNAMKSGDVSSTAEVWRRYTSHDIGHLDTQY